MYDRKMAEKTNPVWSVHWIETCHLAHILKLPTVNK